MWVQRVPRGIDLGGQLTFGTLDSAQTDECVATTVAYHGLGQADQWVPRQVAKVLAAGDRVKELQIDAVERPRLLASGAVLWRRLRALARVQAGGDTQAEKAAIEAKAYFAMGMTRDQVMLAGKQLILDLQRVP